MTTKRNNIGIIWLNQLLFIFDINKNVNILQNGQQIPSKENNHLQSAELSYSIDDDSHRLSSSPNSANLENDSFANNVGSDKTGKSCFVPCIFFKY